MGQNINDIQRELARIRDENARLKELLRKHAIAHEATPSPIAPMQKRMSQVWLGECRLNMGGCNFFSVNNTLNYK